MSSPKLVERFPALFWTPDEFDSPDTESVRPIRVALLKRTKGPFIAKGTKTLTRPDKLASKDTHVGVDPASGPSTSKILLAHPGPPMESVDPGDPKPTVNIQKVGSGLVKVKDLLGAQHVTDMLLHAPADGTTEALKEWAEKMLGDKSPIILESTPHSGPKDPVVTVKTVGDFMDFYNKQIAEGLAVPEEYWNPEAGTNKGKCFEEAGVFAPTGACASCMNFGGAFLDPLSGYPISVVCFSDLVNPVSAAEKYTYDVAGKEAGCVYYEPANGSNGN